MAKAISSDCDLTYTAAHNSGTRDTKEISWVVLHSTEGDDAKGAAAWFANPESEGSAHIVVDDTICYRTLKNDQIPWAAPGANTKGFHIEQAGFARWTRAQWLAHDATIRRAAYKAAVHCKLFKIPVRFLGAPSLKAGLKGITTHAECTKAFGGTHTDPGANYPLDIFIKYAKEYFAELSV